MKFNLTAEFDTIEDLVEFFNKIKNDDPVVHVMAENTSTVSAKAESFVSLADPKPAEEAPTLPKAEPEPALTPVEHKFDMSRDEVKAYCATARTEKQVNIKQILTGMGVATFSALPDDKLEALYDRVKAARGD